MTSRAKSADYYADGLGVASYDCLLNGAAVEGDIAFYLECARQFGGPVLELATGTGRVLVPLAMQGIEITGLDLSGAMLARAAEKLHAQGIDHERVQLVEADMTNFELGRQFALAIVPFRSFQHVTEPAAQRAALRCIHRHLKPGGFLVIDMFDPCFHKMVDPGAIVGTVREARDSVSDTLFRRTVVARDVDFVRQVVCETMLLQALDSQGTVIAEESAVWALKWMERQETVYLLELCGFEPLAEYSDFRKSPPAYGKEQLWVACKVDR